MFESADGLERLNDDQRRAAVHDGGPLLILAPQIPERVELAPWPLLVPQLDVEAEGRLVPAKVYGSREELAAVSAQSARLRWHLQPGAARS